MSVLLISQVLSTPVRGNSWDINTLDYNLEVGAGTAIVIDNNNNPHIIYGDTKNEAMKALAWTGSDWNTEMVEQLEISDYTFVSLIIDSNDYLHVAYYDDVNCNIHYGKLTENGWDVEIIADYERVVGIVSLALDSNNWPYITYMATDGQKTLKYTTWTGTSWISEVIETLDNTSEIAPSIYLDSDDNIHIVYCHAKFVDYILQEGNIKHARKESTGWNIEIIDNSSFTIPSLVLDSNNQAHVIYQDEIQTLKYARHNNNYWNITSVDENAGLESSLILDSNDNPHIAYCADNKLKYAQCVGVWKAEIVDSTAFDVGFISLAIDDDGNLHISYFDTLRGDLRYASNTSKILANDYPFTNYLLFTAAVVIVLIVGMWYYLKCKKNKNRQNDKIDQTNQELSRKPPKEI